MSNAPLVTICSVYYSQHSKKLLEENYRFTKQRNRTPFTWIAADNSPDEAQIKLEIPIETYRFMSLSKFQETLPESLRPILSFHHSGALNMLKDKVKTRYFISLDPDFYIVRPEWIEQMVTHMQKHELAMLGASWHPRWWKKKRYFPTQPAIMVDLEKIQASELDFSPAYTADNPRPKFGPKILWALNRIPGVNRLTGPILRRMSIGTSLDTSYKLMERFMDGYVVECIPGAFIPSEDSIFHQTFISRFLDGVLPDKYSYVPKKKGYFSSLHFRDFLLPDTAILGWEEFMWADDSQQLEQPFGFHLRSSRVDKRDYEKEYDLLKDILKKIVS